MSDNKLPIPDSFQSTLNNIISSYNVWIGTSPCDSEQIKKLNTQLTSLDSNIRTNLNILTNNFDNLRNSINTLKAQNEDYKAQLNNIKSTHESSDTMIHNYKQVYDYTYLKNWGLILSILISGYAISKVYKKGNNI